MTNPTLACRLTPEAAAANLPVRMSPDELQELVEEATFDFTMGENRAALEKLERALAADPRCFEAWHAKCEVHFSERAFDDARDAAEKALALRPDDIHIHTSLSRIYMEKGDKATAEKHGAQARMLGWKNELENESPGESAGADR
jgi:Tfp pilus assembly protein PilF